MITAASALAPESVVTAFRMHRRARRRRAVLATTAVGATVAALVVVTLMVGSTIVPPLDVLAAVFGFPPDPATDFVVRGLRMPRAVTALLVGAALGVSGTIFQRLLGNTLASPDFLGVASGATVAAVAGIVLGDLGGLGLSVAALVGALATSIIIGALAWRGGLGGYRFILIGVGVTAAATAITTYLVSRAEVADARAATRWLTGSVGMASETDIIVLGLAVVVLIPLAVLLGRPLRMLELGDDVAQAVGVRVQAERIALMAIAVVLVAFATSAAGPLAFVALMAGPLATRLVGGAGSGIVASAFVGAAIVLMSDIVAHQLLPVALPTGVITGIVGAPYLVWLLVSANRKGVGG